MADSSILITFRHLGVAQSGQSSRFGSELPLVQIQPPRPIPVGTTMTILTRDYRSSNGYGSPTLKRGGSAPDFKNIFTAWLNTYNQGRGKNYQSLTNKDYGSIMFSGTPNLNDMRRDSVAVGKQSGIISSGSSARTSPSNPFGKVRGGALNGGIL